MKEFVVVNNKEVHLQAYIWEPDFQTDKAILLVHSYGDSSYRYQWFASELVKQGFVVCSYDLVAHGRSGGLRAKWISLNNLLDDLNLMIKWFRHQINVNNWYGIGMGFGSNLIAVNQLNTNEYQFSGLCLWAPIVRLSTRFPKVILDSILYVNSITSHLNVLTLQANMLTSNTERLYSEIPDWDDDYGKVSAKTAGIIINSGKTILKNWDKLTIPIWVGWGKYDQLADSDWFSQSETNSLSSTKDFHEFEKAYHYLDYCEIGFEVLFSIKNWLNAKVNTTQTLQKTYF
jgi:alpha-beta hydrolase superfamily lysophospholipase